MLIQSKSSALAVMEPRNRSSSVNRCGTASDAPVNGLVTTVHAIPGSSIYEAPQRKKGSGDVLNLFHIGSGHAIHQPLKMDMAILIRYTRHFHRNGRHHRPNCLAFPIFLELRLASQFLLIPPPGKFQMLLLLYGFLLIESFFFIDRSSTNGTDSSVKDDPRWVMSDVSSSLYGVRDHTLQLAEGYSL